MLVNTVDVVRAMRQRQDALLGKLHALTKRRDAHLDTMEGTLGQEQALVAELGQIQDRLSLLGEHPFCGCEKCRPAMKSSADEPRTTDRD